MHDIFLQQEFVRKCFLFAIYLVVLTNSRNYGIISRIKTVLHHMKHIKAYLRASVFQFHAPDKRFETHQSYFMELLASIRW